ncbi:DUF406 family protein [Endozoicomonas montiporae]|nr:DUF406 family protein [Endozoicomonas montiporae]AMO57955.1 hypothetical protein EZMO1_4019 [Endozoicomonas montiporae CL-33]
MKDTDQYESAACNCVEVGTLIREDDTLLTLDFCDNDQMTAKEQFDRMEKDALSVGSGNCQIQSEMVEADGKPIIRAMFDFDCTAEKLIFQMKHK